MSIRAATVIYGTPFALLTWAYFETTNLGVRSGAGRETNSLVEDASGGISGRFLVANLVFGIFASLAFMAGWRGISKLRDRGDRPSVAAALAGFDAGPAAAAFRWLIASLILIGMKLFVALNNLSVLIAGWSPAGGVRQWLGGDASWPPAVLAGCVLMAASFGFALAAALAPALIGTSRASRSSIDDR